jgi:aspartate racemase
MFQRVSGVRILDMVEIVCRYALEQKPTLKQIALLSTEATAKSAIYQKTFAAKNIEVVLPSVDERRKISFVIEQVKIGQAEAAVTREAIIQVINSMIHQGIDTIILGCTELPEVSIRVPMQCLLIDTTQALVQGTIDAVELIKTEKLLGKIKSKL